MKLKYVVEITPDDAETSGQMGIMRDMWDLWQGLNDDERKTGFVMNLERAVDGAYHWSVDLVLVSSEVSV